MAKHVFNEVITVFVNDKTTRLIEKNTSVSYMSARVNISLEQNVKTNTGDKYLQKAHFKTLC